MLVSPKWHTMWLESQYCSKTIVNMNLPTQQIQKLLEDLKTNCCSPNKAIQLEALKCWKTWINNQNPEDWKVNSVCFTAVRPLISKKLQPLYKDVDICKMKLSLMWALLIKVQFIMHLEGPQYILEVFLQSCLTWLYSLNGNGCENEVSVLIFQLLLGIFKKNETLIGCDKEIFPPLSTDILLSNKVFYHFADKLLNIFIHWKKVQDKNIILKLWKHFLEHCELSCEHIPIPVWHKVFKIAGQICSEKSESVKERLSFLHSCATTLKSALTSSKFIDFGNLMTTPCEALFKKLVELCSVECNECFDLEMFMHSKEICQVLSDRSVEVGGFDLCISVLDVLEEFWLRSLLWGVWCGLVYCYKVRLLNIDVNNFTKIQMKFYRKLRGFVANFELDRNDLHEDCVEQVEKHIEFLNISCLCSCQSTTRNDKAENCSRKVRNVEAMSVDIENQPFGFSSSSHPLLQKIVPMAPNSILGEFRSVFLYNKSKLRTKTFSFKYGLIKNIIDKISVKWTPLFNGLFLFRFINLRASSFYSISHSSLCLKIIVQGKGVKNFALPCLKAKSLPLVGIAPKKNPPVMCEVNSKVKILLTPKTKNKRTEEKKKEIESHRKKKRKTFEVLVQEIVKKNKERKNEKNEKNTKERKSLILLKDKKNKKKEGKKSGGTRNKKDQKKLVNKEKENKHIKVSERKLKTSKREKPISQIKKKNNLLTTDGKLENYFKIINKKLGSEVKKKEKKPKKEKKSKEKKGRENSCCSKLESEGERKGETAWRQTSLKMMMNEKSKPQKLKEDLRTRSKTAKITHDKLKINKKINKKVTGISLPNLSPFIEVFHDHEYAKLEPRELQTVKRVIPPKTESSADQRNAQKCKKLKDEFLNLKKVEIEEMKTEHEEKPEDPIIVHNHLDVNFTINDDSLQEKEYKEITSTLTRSKKRIKQLQCVKPSKKIKLDEKEKLPPEITIEENLEEKLPLEITEKENLVEKQQGLSCLSRVEKNDGFPKNINGTISSRALRMIALVPDSTKSSQIQWESPSRGELLKCKKAPNVDKNSRASKMLALLSENVVEVEVINDFKGEDFNCYKSSVTTPKKTPISSLKSPSLVKKRRSVRFDDAKNETVLYQIDTPPSQVLEVKKGAEEPDPQKQQ